MSGTPRHDPPLGRREDIGNVDYEDFSDLSAKLLSKLFVVASGLELSPPSAKEGF